MRSLTSSFFTLLAAALGCARAAPPAPRTPVHPPQVEARTPAPAGSSVPVAYLPHPAFARAARSGTDAPSIADIAERVLPSVVNISSTRVVQLSRGFRRDPFFPFFFGPGHGGPRERQERGMGSGVIVSADGVILTNNHVVEGAQDIRVTTADKRELGAVVVGTDPKSDLAVIKVEGKVDHLVPIELGDSSRLRLGDIVLAVGNPFGVGQTVTMGIVSAKGRANVGIVDYEDFIQTDAAINPGNSGGALINTEGRLVGINTAILSRTGGSMGIGFAIPTNMAKPIMKSLLERGKVVRGWLGVVIQGLDGDLARAMRLPPGTKGVLISDVVPEGPARKAGLKRGDVVQKIDGAAVDSPGQLRNTIASAGAGASVALDVLRRGRILHVRVPLAEMPDHLGASRPSRAPPGGALDGLTLERLDDVNRRKFGIPARIRRGVLVLDVDPGTPAARAGLRPGDVLLEVNRTGVDDVAGLKRAYGKSRGRVLLLVYRDGSTAYLVLRR